MKNKMTVADFIKKKKIKIPKYTEPRRRKEIPKDLKKNLEDAIWAFFENGNTPESIRKMVSAALKNVKQKNNEM